MKNNEQDADQQSQLLRCPVCGDSLCLQIAKGRKSGKVFLMWKCVKDGRHFRGFINHRPFVERVIQNLEGLNRNKN